MYKNVVHSFFRSFIEIKKNEPFFWYIELDLLEVLLLIELCYLLMVFIFYSISNYIFSVTFLQKAFSTFMENRYISHKV